MKNAIEQIFSKYKQGKDKNESQKQKNKRIT